MAESYEEVTGKVAILQVEIMCVNPDRVPRSIEKVSASTIFGSQSSSLINARVPKYLALTYRSISTEDLKYCLWRQREDVKFPDDEARDTSMGLAKTT